MLVLGSSDVCREDGQRRQVAEDVAIADDQLATRFPPKVFSSACKKVLHRSWIDGDPPAIKSEILIKIVFGARTRV